MNHGGMRSKSAAAHLDNSRPVQGDGVLTTQDDGGAVPLLAPEVAFVHHQFGQKRVAANSFYEYGAELARARGAHLFKLAILEGQLATLLKADSGHSDPRRLGRVHRKAKVPKNHLASSNGERRPYRGCRKIGIVSELDGGTLRGILGLDQELAAIRSKSQPRRPAAPQVPFLIQIDELHCQPKIECRLRALQGRHQLTGVVNFLGNIRRRWRKGRTFLPMVFAIRRISI